MAARLDPKETAWLYGVIFTCSLLFFLIGVYVGKSYFSPPGQPLATFPHDDGPVVDVKPQLDFYQELAQPAQTAEEGQDSPPDPSRGAVSGQADQPRVEPPEPPQPAPASGTPGTAYYTVQVAALNSAEEAGEFRLRVEAKGYSVKVAEPEPGQKKFFRLWVGELETRSDARQLAGRLKRDGFLTYIKKVQRPN
ncbi:MAG: SPOR domain-containing protein [Acidobacteriota bacterium]